VSGGRSAPSATCTPLTAIVGAPDLDDLREQLGAEGFDRAWSQGRALSADELVDSPKDFKPQAHFTVGFSSGSAVSFSIGKGDPRPVKKDGVDAVYFSAGDPDAATGYEILKGLEIRARGLIKFPSARARRHARAARQ